MVRTWDFIPSEEEPPEALNRRGALCLGSEATLTAVEKGAVRFWFRFRGERKVAGAAASAVGQRAGAGFWA